MSILNTPVTITRFGSQFASDAKVDQGSMRQIAALVRKVSADSKANLPWIKLASFGETAPSAARSGTTPTCCPSQVSKATTTWAR